MGDVRPLRSESTPPRGLTPIHRRIHCAATPDTPDEELTELDRIDLDNFIKELAAITVSITRRDAASSERAA